MGPSLKIAKYIIKHLCLLNIFNAIKAQNTSYQNAFPDVSLIDVEFASSCLWNLTEEIFGRKKFISFLNCNITKEPGYSVMSKAIMMHHNYKATSSFSYESIQTTQKIVTVHESAPTKT